jgi:hypothetical protein
VEWDEKERSRVLALLEYESQQCSGCGGWMPETTDPDARFEASPPYRCYRCDAVYRLRNSKEYSPERVKGPIEALQIWPVKKKG